MENLKARNGWQDNIKVDLKKLCENVAEDGVNIINIWGPVKGRDFIDQLSKYWALNRLCSMQ